MNIYVLDQNFTRIGVIDDYESLLWVDRYNEPGEFEIYAAVTSDILEYAVVNNYLQIAESDRVMIVEDIEIESNSETGNKIRITGRSLESILSRRCVDKTTNVKGVMQKSIEQLIAAFVTRPQVAARRIPNFIYVTPLPIDSYIASLTFEKQYRGDTILKIVEDMCQSKNIGFKVTLDESKKEFHMTLYRGSDRSYDQNTLPYVVFKPSFDNVISSEYKENNSSSKTFVYVHSQYYNGTQTVDVTRTADSAVTGLLRKEHYTESSIVIKEGMTLNDYYAQLDQDARGVLSNYKVSKSFSGKYDTTNMFKYGEDFFLGDIVQVANEYGMESTSRVTEYMWSVSNEGVEHYPTFTPI